MANEGDWLEYWGLYCLRLTALEKLDQLKDELLCIKEDIKKEAEWVVCDLLKVPNLVSRAIVNNLHVYDMFALFQVYEERCKSKSK